MAPKPAGIINMGLKSGMKKFKYKYQPPYGYGGNLSKKPLNKRLERNMKPSTSAMQNQHYNFMDQISKPVVNSNSYSENRGSYMGRMGNKVMESNIIADPNLSIKPIGDFIDPKRVSSPNYPRKGSRNRMNNHSHTQAIDNHGQGQMDELDLEEERKKFFLVDEENDTSGLPPLNPKTAQHTAVKNRKMRYPNTQIDQNIYNKFNSNSNGRTDSRKREIVNRSANLESIKSRQNTALAASASNILPIRPPEEERRPSSNIQKYTYNSNEPYNPNQPQKKRSATDLSRNKLQGLKSHDNLGFNGSLGERNKNNNFSQNMGGDIPDIRASKHMKLLNSGPVPKDPYAYNVISATYEQNRL